MNCNTDLYWHGCYKGNYDLITPESIAHPAKMSFRLCFRILEHLEEIGLLQEGMTILDPMAGTGIVNICAGALGYASVSVELEEKFVAFQRANKEYAGGKLHKPLDWQIIQGDSRRLSELLQERGLVSITSPPYGETGVGDWKTGRAEFQAWVINEIKTKGYVEWQGKQYTEAEWRAMNHGRIDGRTTKGVPKHPASGYSENSANIGNLPDKPLVSITSPPYANQTIKDGQRLASNPDIHWREWDRGTGYNLLNPANIGNLPDKPLVSKTSPPYEGGGHHKGMLDSWGGRNTPVSNRNKENHGYGDTLGQIEHAESYLEAMAQVYSEIAKVSNVLVIVLKNPTRKGKIHRLDLASIQILEQTRWTIHCQHRAFLFEELEQATLFGETQKRIKGRLSFFKMLSYKKGQPVAAWEDIIICVR